MKWSAVGKLIALYMMMIGLAVYMACGNNSPNHGQTVSTTTTTTTTTSTVTPTTPASTKPLAGALVTADDCHTKSTVWYPNTSNNGPPACGESRVTWPCCKAEVLARFADMKEDTLASLKNSFSQWEGLNYTLSDCGKKSDTEYELIWVNVDSDGNYSSHLTGISAAAKSTVDASVTCPQTL